MARMVTTTPKKGSGGGFSGPQYTEEQKAEYNAKWGRYAQLFARRPKGGRRDFFFVATEISDPFTEPNTFPGAAPGSMRTVRTIKGMLLGEGVTGLRFQAKSADNVQNDKTQLYQLYLAVHGETPPDQTQAFSYDVDALQHVPVKISIEKQDARQDGKRGGFYTAVRGFTPIYEDETVPDEVRNYKPGDGVDVPAGEGEASAQQQRRHPEPQPEVAPRRQGLTPPSPPSDEDDEVPF